MSHSIYKYPVAIVDEFQLRLPVNAQVLDIQMQHNVPVLWAIVNTTVKGHNTRHFICRGTGHPIDPVQIIRHVSTVQDGGFIWHFFEVHENAV